MNIKIDMGGYRKLMKHNAITAREGMVEQFHAFITPVLDGVG
jgi:hypothetical protein